MWPPAPENAPALKTPTRLDTGDTDRCSTIITIACAASTTTDPAGLTRQHHRANTLGTPACTQEAIDRARVLLEDCGRILGPQHPVTVATGRLLEGLVQQHEQGSQDDH